MDKEQQISRKSLFNYGIFALPLSFAGLPLYLHIPDLYATQFGVPLATIGIILLGIRLLDAFQDPVIGVLARNLKLNKNKLGKVVFGTAIIIATAMWFLMNPNEILPTYAWFAVFMLICTTSFSVLSIIYQSVGAVWKEDYHTRTRITTTREAIGLVGITLAAILPSILTQLYEPQMAFSIFVVIFAVLILSISIWWIIWLKSVDFESVQDGQDNKPFSFLKMKSTRPLFVIWFVSQLASAIPVVLVIFFIRDKLELEHLTGLFLLMYFLSGVLGMPLWRFVEYQKGKQKTWQLSMMLAVVAFIFALFLGEGDAVGFAFVCIFSGMALGGELAIPPSILADRISKEGASMDATKFFGVSTFLGKFALALASGLVLTIIAYWGYSPTAENSEIALDALTYSYALLPCLIKILAIALLYFVKLEGDKNGNRNET